MLNNDVTVLLHDLLAYLGSAQGAEPAALAKRVQAALASSARHKARLAETAARRPTKPKRGAPTRVFIIEVEPGGVWRCNGARAACGKIKELLTEFGSNRTVPNPNSLGVTLSRGGAWQAMADTDNGTVSILCRYPREDELA
jgi:hypothetical protein